MIGYNGTSLMEVTAITNLSVILPAVRCLVLTLLPATSRKSNWIRFLLEWCVMVFPLILTTTVLADDSYGILFSVLIVTVLSILSLPAANHDPASINVNHLLQPTAEEIMAEENSSDGEVRRKQPTILEHQIPASHRSHNITMLRAYITIISCICILAVDFRVFPRRLAKTETFGSGLMDTGVGLFVMSNGIVSLEAKGRLKNLRTLGEKFTHIRSVVLSLWPLILIGMGRFISVKLLGYQEHVTEYGIHWNFFFTLATVKLLSALLFSFIDTRYCFLLAGSLVVMSQIMLSCFSFDSLLLNSDRSGFFMANKEGLFTCIGYLAIYVASVQYGSFLLRVKQISMRSWLYICGGAILVDILLWATTIFTIVYVQPISRRLANAAFVLWIFSLSLEFYIAFSLVDMFLVFCIHRGKLSASSKPGFFRLTSKDQIVKDVNIDYRPAAPPVCILSAVNSNQLFYFLLSNLATGLVNCFFDTMRASRSEAVCILSIYTLSILSIIWFLSKRQLTVKFW